MVELLVVIVIIAVLAAIVLPVLAQAQMKGRMANDLANLQQVAVAMQQYRKDYKQFPPAALDPTWNTPGATGLKDDQGRDAYTGADYNTEAAGRKTRVSCLYPSYLDSQAALISPEEDQASDLVTRNAQGENTGTINGQDPKVLLEVGGDGSLSTYDDYYNAYGYNADGTCITAKNNEVGGGRKAPRLNNRYAPGNTIICQSREFEFHFDGDAEITLVARVDGRVDRIPRKIYDWSTQPEVAHN